MSFYFSRSPDSSEETDRYTKKIARLAGLNPEDVNQEELIYIYMQGDDKDNRLLINLALKYAPESTHDDARFQALMQDIELCLNLPYNYFSYGMFHPSYQRCLLEYLRSTHTSNHSGLLLGAITTETIREFAQTVRGVYPGAELTTVDIESPTKFRNPDGLTNFVRCDALVLARRSVIQASSIDTVHTNVLLPHLKGTDNLTTEGARQKLFEGIFSTLRPQGMAILVEFVSTPISSPETLRGAAESVGLTDIDSQPAQIFRTRRGMDRFFRGSNLSASQSEIVTLPSMHVFSARKP